jgi:hypothetical protein
LKKNWLIWYSQWTEYLCCFSSSQWCGDSPLGHGCLFTCKNRCKNSGYDPVEWYAC